MSGKQKARHEFVFKSRDGSLLGKVDGVDASHYDIYKLELQKTTDDEPVLTVFYKTDTNKKIHQEWIKLGDDHGAHFTVDSFGGVVALLSSDPTGRYDFRIKFKDHKDDRDALLKRLDKFKIMMVKVIDGRCPVADLKRMPKTAKKLGDPKGGKRAPRRRSNLGALAPSSTMDTREADLSASTLGSSSNSWKQSLVPQGVFSNSASDRAKPLKGRGQQMMRAAAKRKSIDYKGVLAASHQRRGPRSESGYQSRSSAPLELTMRSPAVTSNSHYFDGSTTTRVINTGRSTSNGRVQTGGPSTGGDDILDMTLGDTYDENRPPTNPGASTSSYSTGGHHGGQRPVSPSSGFISRSNGHALSTGWDHESESSRQALRSLNSSRGSRAASSSSSHRPELGSNSFSSSSSLRPSAPPPPYVPPEVYKPDPSLRVNGIHNEMNTCYQASVYQVLLHQDHFMSDMERDDIAKCGLSKESFFGKFRDLIRMARKKNHGELRISALQQAFQRVYPDFDRRTQQDAQEFFTFLLGMFDTDMSRYLVSSAHAPPPSPTSSSSSSSSGSTKKRKIVEVSDGEDDDAKDCDADAESESSDARGANKRRRVTLPLANPEGKVDGENSDKPSAAAALIVTSSSHSRSPSPEHRGSTSPGKKSSQKSAVKPVSRPLLRRNISSGDPRQPDSDDNKHHDGGEHNDEEEVIHLNASSSDDDDEDALLQKAIALSQAEEDDQKPVADSVAMEDSDGEGVPPSKEKGAPDSDREMPSAAAEANGDSAAPMEIDSRSDTADGVPESYSEPELQSQGDEDGSDTEVEESQRRSQAKAASPAAAADSDVGMDDDDKEKPKDSDDAKSDVPFGKQEADSDASPDDSPGDWPSDMEFENENESGFESALSFGTGSGGASSAKKEEAAPAGGSESKRPEKAKDDKKEAEEGSIPFAERRHVLFPMDRSFMTGLLFHRTCHSTERKDDSDSSSSSSSDDERSSSSSSPPPVPDLSGEMTIKAHENCLLFHLSDDIPCELIPLPGDKNYEKVMERRAGQLKMRRKLRPRSAKKSSGGLKGGAAPPVLVPMHENCTVHSQHKMQLRQPKNGTAFFGCPLFKDQSVRCKITCKAVEQERTPRTPARRRGPVDYIPPEERRPVSTKGKKGVGKSALKSVSSSSSSSRSASSASTPRDGTKNVSPVGSPSAAAAGEKPAAGASSGDGKKVSPPAPAPPVPKFLTREQGEAARRKAEQRDSVPLRNLIHHYFSPEEGVRFKCDKCPKGEDGMSPHTRQAFISKLPQVFVVYIQRKMDHITGEKNHQRIEIPNELDLAPFVRPDKPVDAPFPMRALLPPLPSQAHPPGKRPYHTTYPSRSAFPASPTVPPLDLTGGNFSHANPRDLNISASGGNFVPDSALKGVGNYRSTSTSGVNYGNSSSGVGGLGRNHDDDRTDPNEVHRPGPIAKKMADRVRRPSPPPFPGTGGTYGAGSRRSAKHRNKRSGDRDGLYVSHGTHSSNPFGAQGPVTDTRRNLTHDFDTSRGPQPSGYGTPYVRPANGVVIGDTSGAIHDVSYRGPASHPPAHQGKMPREIFEDGDHRPPADSIPWSPEGETDGCTHFRAPGLPEEHRARRLQKCANWVEADPQGDFWFRTCFRKYIGEAAWARLSSDVQNATAALSDSHSAPGPGPAAPLASPPPHPHPHPSSSPPQIHASGMLPAAHPDAIKPLEAPRLTGDLESGDIEMPEETEKDPFNIFTHEEDSMDSSVRAAMEASKATAAAEEARRQEADKRKLANMTYEQQLQHVMELSLAESGGAGGSGGSSPRRSVGGCNGGGGNPRRSVGGCNGGGGNPRRSVGGCSGGSREGEVEVRSDCESDSSEDEVRPPKSKRRRTLVVEGEDKNVADEKQKLAATPSDDVDGAPSSRSPKHDVDLTNEGDESTPAAVTLSPVAPRRGKLSKSPRSGSGKKSAKTPAKPKRPGSAGSGSKSARSNRKRKRDDTTAAAISTRITSFFSPSSSKKSPSSSPTSASSTKGSVAQRSSMKRRSSAIDLAEDGVNDEVKGEAEDGVKEEHGAEGEVVKSEPSSSSSSSSSKLRRVGDAKDVSERPSETEIPVSRSTRYLLKAMICHRGPKANGGHYVCDTFDAHRSKWTHWNDEDSYDAPPVAPRGVDVNDKNRQQTVVMLMFEHEEVRKHALESLSIDDGDGDGGEKKESESSSSSVKSEGGSATQEVTS